jgi:hypothetical protein
LNHQVPTSDKTRAVPEPDSKRANEDESHMSSAIIRITDRPYTMTIQTGSNEPGLGKMAMISNDSPKSMELRLDYSLLPGADNWKTDVPGLLPVMWGKWEMEETEREWTGNKTAILSGHGIGRFLRLRPYAGAGVFGQSWRTWPDNPFRKGLTGTGNRLGINIASWSDPHARHHDLNPEFGWECLDAD